MRRDPWFDAVRAGALLVVVLGHWLVAVVHEGDDGLRTSSLLTLPWSHWLTLGLQVMGAFFVVGGAVSVRSWRRSRRYGPWLRKRVAGLVHPALPVVILWLVVPPLLTWFGVPGEILALGRGKALVPLWFLAVYVFVQMLVPLLDAAAARISWQVQVVALLAASALVDATDLVPLSFVVVWALPVVLGVALADDRLEYRHALWMVLGGVALLCVLLSVLDYPVLMVGASTPELASNQAPATLALSALNVVHAGLLVATRRPLQRALAPVAPLVERLAAVSLGLFLWHLTGLVVAVGVALLIPAAVAGLLRVDPLSLTWWLSRPLWWAVLALWTAPLVWLSLRYERTAGSGSAWLGERSLPVLAGAACAVVGFALVVVLPGTAWPGAAALTLAAKLLGALPGRPARPDRDGAALAAAQSSPPRSSA